MDNQWVESDHQGIPGSRRQGLTPGKKLIIGIGLLLLLSALFAYVFHAANARTYVLQSLETRASQMKPLRETVDRIMTLFRNSFIDSENRRLGKLTLTVSAFEDEMLEESGGRPVLFGEGAVVRVKDGEVECPEGLPDYLRMDADDFTDQDSQESSFTRISPEDVAYTVYFTCLQDDLYYIQWIVESNEDEEQSEDDVAFDMDKSLGDVEKAYGTSMLIFYPDFSDSSDLSTYLYYRSPNLPEYDKSDDFGITGEMIAKAVDSDSDPTTGQLMDAYSLVEVDSVKYEMFLQKSIGSADEGTEVIACLVPYQNTRTMILGQTLMVLIVFVVIGIFLLVWAYTTFVLVRDYSLREDQKNELAPKTVRRHGLSILATGGVIILIAVGLFLALSRLFLVCNQVTTSLDILKQRMEEDVDLNKRIHKTQNSTYEEFAYVVARFLENDPEVASREKLQRICDTIGVDYIMLFNRDGKETMSNSPYTGVSLSEDPEEDTYQFRKLLMGKSTVLEEGVKDELSDLEMTMIGASIRVNKEDEEAEPVYEALVMAVPSDKLYDSSALTISETMSSLVSERMLSFSVDPETHLIKAASNTSLTGKNAIELGLPERALFDGYRDFFTLDGLPYYGECTQIGGDLYYCAAVQSDIYKNMWRSVLLAFIAYVVLMGVYLFSLLLGYRHFFEEWASIGESLEQSDDRVMLSRGRLKRSIDPSLRWKPTVRKYGARTPIHMAIRVIELLLTMIILFYYLGMAAFMNGGSNTSLLSFILQGRWAKGVNLFSITSIVILFGYVFLAVTILKVILRVGSEALGTKGETVCRLLLNLVNYAGVLVFAYFALYDLGLNPGTLIASLGLITFAISLGAKDLITDIIAGLSIVFEGDYQVGDIIEVNEYRGEVLEIGVRTTKLEGKGGNIKIIGNRDVKNVINMTRKNSWVSIEVGISNNKPIPEVGQMIETLLPEIGQAIPQIISGPFYKGVSSIDRGGVNTLLITAECMEGDYYTVQRALNSEIRESFEKHGIQIV